MNSGSGRTGTVTSWQPACCHLALTLSGLDGIYDIWGTDAETAAQSHERRFGVTMPLGGWLSDTLTRRYGPTIGRRFLIVIGIGGCGIFLVLAADTPDANTAITYIAASVGFLTLNCAAFWSTPINLSPKDAGVISGMMNTSGNIAGIFAPSITGMLVTFYDNKFENAMYFGAALFVLGILILISVGRVRPIETASAAKL